MLSKEDLEREYVQNRKSCQRIANEYGLAARTIHSWLVRYDIPRRDNTKPSNKIDMTGFKVGNLLVVGQAPERKANQAAWIVECQQCNVRFAVPGGKIRHRQIGGCQSCGKHPNFRGCGDIYGQYWTNLKRGAVSRGLEFTVTIEEAWQLYLSQDGKCALSGLPIVFERSRGRAAEKTASLDRIDSTKGYLPDNTRT